MGRDRADLAAYDFPRDPDKRLDVTRKRDPEPPEALTYNMTKQAQSGLRRVSRMIQEPQDRGQGVAGRKAEKEGLRDCHFTLSFLIRPDPESFGLRAKASAKSPM